ncbi:MAG: 50S ribosomal protein L35 [Planctomycetes bacterium]|nr:50S ribosomal protein L35 [Planctomycetota bacterium]
MPKQKTHKGIAKRFTVTASGKAKCRSAFRGHLLSHKSGNRKRHNRADTVLVGADALMIREALRPAK